MNFSADFTSTLGNTKISVLSEKDRALFARLCSCEETMAYVADTIDELKANVLFQQRLSLSLKFIGCNSVSNLPCDSWLTFSIADTATNYPIGTIGIKILAASGQDLMAEIGYILAPENCGLGHGSRALSLGIAIAEQLGILELYAYSAEANKASISILKKNGFRQAEFLPANTTIRGMKVDDIKFCRASKQVGLYWDT